VAVKKTTGAATIKANFQKFIARIRPNVVEIVEETCEEIAARARADHGKDAHEQKRYMNRSGDLTRSIDIGIIPTDQKKVVGFVKADTKYAPDVELGTDHNKPYPFMFPALLASKQSYKSQMSKVTK